MLFFERYLNCLLFTQCEWCGSFSLIFPFMYVLIAQPNGHNKTLPIIWNCILAICTQKNISEKAKNPESFCRFVQKKNRIFLLTTHIRCKSNFRSWLSIVVVLAFCLWFHKMCRLIFVMCLKSKSIHIKCYAIRDVCLTCLARCR